MCHVNDIPRFTFSTYFLAAAFPSLIVVSNWGCMMGETWSSSNRVPAAHARNTLPLVRKLPLDDADLLSQSFGSARLTDAVLSWADLVETCLQVVQLLFQRQSSPVLWQKQICDSKKLLRLLNYLSDNIMMSFIRMFLDHGVVSSDSLERKFVLFVRLLLCET